MHVGDVADVILNESNDSKMAPTGLSPTSHQVASVKAESSVDPLPARSDYDVDDVFALFSQATGTPKTDLSSFKVTEFMLVSDFCDLQRMFQDNNDQALVSAMSSLVVSPSPKKPTPRPLVPLRTTPVRNRKYYLVSVGKRTGVFDSWLVPISFIIAVLNPFLTGRMFKALHLGFPEVVRSRTPHAVRPRKPMKLLS